jgi:hypothetical protein
MIFIRLHPGLRHGRERTMKMTRYSIIAAVILTIGSGCSNKEKREAEIEAARQAAIDSVNNVVQRERMIDSMNRAGIEDHSVTVLPPDEAPKADKPQTKPRNTPAKKNEGTAKTPEPKSDPTPTPTTNPGGNAPTTPPSTGGSGNETAGTETGSAGTGTVEAPKKKGVPTAVKGAVIGAGAGAIGGAIIDKKNPGKGAIIGGVIGAGAGAATGIILDKNKKKKAAKDTAAAPTSGKQP